MYGLRRQVSRTALQSVLLPLSADAAGHWPCQPVLSVPPLLQDAHLTPDDIRFAHAGQPVSPADCAAATDGSTNDICTLATFRPLYYGPGRVKIEDLMTNGLRMRAKWTVMQSVPLLSLSTDDIPTHADCHSAS